MIFICSCVRSDTFVVSGITNSQNSIKFSIDYSKSKGIYKDAIVEITIVLYVYKTANLFLGFLMNMYIHAMVGID